MVSPCALRVIGISDDSSGASLAIGLPRSIAKPPIAYDLIDTKMVGIALGELLPRGFDRVVSLVVTAIDGPRGPQKETPSSYRRRG